jgi:hypothetical protein
MIMSNDINDFEHSYNHNADYQYNNFHNYENNHDLRLQRRLLLP